MYLKNSKFEQENTILEKLNDYGKYKHSKNKFFPCGFTNSVNSRSNKTALSAVVNALVVPISFALQKVKVDKKLGNSSL